MTDFIQSLVSLFEFVLGVGLLFLLFLAFLSMFTRSDEDRYSGAGTLDHSDHDPE